MTYVKQQPSSPRGSNSNYKLDIATDAAAIDAATTDAAATDAATAGATAAATGAA